MPPNCVVDRRCVCFAIDLSGQVGGRLLRRRFFDVIAGVVLGGIFCIVDGTQRLHNAPKTLPSIRHQRHACSRSHSGTPPFVALQVPFSRAPPASRQSARPECAASKLAYCFVRMHTLERLALSALNRLKPRSRSSNDGSSPSDLERLQQQDAGAGAAESSTGDDGFPAKKRTALAKRRNSLFVKRGSISMEPIKTIVLDDVYSVYKQLGTGRFGYIKLAEHKQSKSKIAIKFFERPKMKQVDFIREYNYSFFLSPHPNIIDTYEGMFQAKDESAFLFVQEFCPCASLREAVEGSNGQGIGEHATKEIMIKVLAAIEFMHNENLVHRNLKAENILIFDNKEFSRVKVTDFGLTRKVDTSVKYLEYVNSYHAPELCETVVNEVWTVNKSIDIWAIGVLFYYSLKGRFPWQKATIMCKPYWEWDQWLKRKNPQLPKRWDPFTEKALKLFKRTLNPKHKDRWSVKDVRKCVAKERLLKPSKSMTDDDLYYAPVQNVQIPSARSLNLLDDTKSKQPPKRKSLLHQWVAATFNTMAEISEQVVSARDD
uniref:Protein kinase domain-containing protein n=1 Tax=Plectus sambesii TaxID=2011161 RepID=A0A914W4Z7_9BILA